MDTPGEFQYGLSFALTTDFEETRDAWIAAALADSSYIPTFGRVLFGLFCGLVLFALSK